MSGDPGASSIKIVASLSDNLLGSLPAYRFF